MAHDENHAESSGPLWFRAIRGEGGHFHEWSQYAHSRGGDAAAPLSTIILRARAQQAGREGPSDQESEPSGSDSTATPASSDPVAEWRNSAGQIPWITFVLGSGCLSAWDSTAGSAALRSDIEHNLKESLEEICSRFPGLYLDELVVSYAEALVKERTGDDKATLADVDERTDIQPPYYSSRVLLAATLVTRLYAAALQSPMYVLGRADREEIVIDLNGADAGMIRAEILSPLQVVLSELTAADGDRSSQHAMAKLATAIEQSIGRNALRRTHVELLTAFAWYFLTEGTTVYPGWSELMLFQALEDPNVFMDETVFTTDPNLRPRMSDVRDQADWVYRRIVKVTNSSWKTRYATELGATARPPKETQRDRFYNLVAKLVHQQAQASRFLPAGVGGPPLPVCFVTSFDLELEMAMWAQGIEFLVVLPVFAVEDNRDESTSVHWVWAHIRPDVTDDSGSETTIAVDEAESTPAVLKLPDALVNPREWKTLPAGRLPREIAVGTYPVIVRLTGSPLMSLPTAGVLKLTNHTVDARHALVLDEYTAINQSVQDLRQLGLPRELTEPMGSGAPRFWMMLGTQVGDTGVRLRLMAQQLAARIKDPLRTGPTHRVDGLSPGIRRMGVLVNDKSQNSDRDLFMWHDFDVVDGRHTDRVDDLERLHTDVAAALKNVESKFGDAKGNLTVKARGARA